MRYTFALWATTVPFLATGCSSLIDGTAASQNRDAIVVRTLPRGELPVQLDQRCVASSSSDFDGTVAIVQYRVNRANYLQAFSLGGSQHLRSGDPVRVDPRACTLQIQAARVID